MSSTTYPFPDHITLSGQSKCGKTCTANLLKDAFAAHAFESFDCGELPRRWAAEKNVPLENFVAAMTPEDDRRIDDEAERFLRETPRGIAAGRLTWWVAPRVVGKRIFRVWLHCPTNVCAARARAQEPAVVSRNAEDTRRYFEYYELEFPPARLMDKFDLVLSTHGYPPETIVNTIVRCGLAFAADEPYQKCLL